MKLKGFEKKVEKMAKRVFKVRNRLENFSFESTEAQEKALLNSMTAAGEQLNKSCDVDRDCSFGKKSGEESQESSVI